MKAMTYHTYGGPEENRTLVFRETTGRPTTERQGHKNWWRACESNAPPRAYETRQGTSPSPALRATRLRVKLWEDRN